MTRARCFAQVTPADGVRRPCAFHARPGSIWCHKHGIAAARVRGLAVARPSLDAENHYADTMSRRDREERHTRRPEHDRNPCGRNT